MRDGRGGVGVLAEPGWPGDKSHLLPLGRGTQQRCCHLNRSWRDERVARKDVSRPQAEGKHPPRQEASHFEHLEDCGLSMKGQEKEGRGERRSSFTPS